MAMPPHSAPEQKRSNRWVFWFVSIFVVLAIGFIVMIETAWTQFFNTFNRARPADSRSVIPTEILATLDEHWSRQGLHEIGVEINAPVLLRPEATVAEDDSWYGPSTSYRGWYPIGCIDVIAIKAPGETNPTDDSVEASIEDWVRQTPGSQFSGLHRLSLPGIEQKRFVYEATEVADGYTMVMFVEVACGSEQDVWVALRAFVRDRAPAQADFLRMIRSFKVKVP